MTIDLFLAVCAIDAMALFGLVTGFFVGEHLRRSWNRWRKGGDE